MPKEEIIRYMQMLEKNFGLHISVHSGKIDTSDFLNYGIHANPYCMLIKQNSKLWQKCRCQQSKISSDLSAPKCGTCFAGVFEYILPVPMQNGENSRTFICISGYRDDARFEKQKHLLCKHYGLDEHKLSAAFRTHLHAAPDAPPDESLLSPLLWMLSDYIAAAKSSRSSCSDYVYAHAIAYIHQHYTQKIRLEDICDFCHCSASYISHMFKKRSGNSISAYIMALRLKRAKKLLENGNITVRAAAEAVGFTEPYYFSNSFKKYFHISPSSIANRKEG